MVRIATDIGVPIDRPFQRLATANDNMFGAYHTSGHSQIWRANEEIAWRHSVPNAAEKPNCHFPVPDGQSAYQAAAEHIPALHPNLVLDGWTFEPLNIPIGKSFARLARPHHQHPGDFPTPKLRNEFLHQRAALSLNNVALVSRLETAFTFVDPDERNMAVFSNEFRSILILAATEFEAQCKGILRANQYSAKPEERWNTNDYVKVEPAARLGDYSISFLTLPWVGSIAPFRGWDAEHPTKSLDWYDAYNAVKHDREQHYDRATLRVTIEAVIAVNVLGLAQYGIDFLRRSPLRDTLQVSERPSWSIGDTDGNDFENGGAIERTNFPFE